MLKNLISQAPRPPKLLNSVAVAKNGDLYFTDSSSDVGIDRLDYSFFLNPSGRMIHFSRSTSYLTVLLDDLWFANGIALSPNEEFLVISDLLRSKLVQYWLKPGKIGEIRTFADGLPGLPDNLTPDKDGLWVALPVTIDAQNPLLPQSMTRIPSIRKFLARVIGLVELLFNSIDSVLPNDFCKTAAHKASTMFSFSYSKRATIIRYDWEGKAVAAYHSLDGSLYTHVMELNGELYLGSFVHNYIAKVPRRAHV